jgi:hypothetical protein
MLFLCELECVAAGLIVCVQLVSLPCQMHKVFNAESGRVRTCSTLQMMLLMLWPANMHLYMLQWCHLHSAMAAGTCVVFCLGSECCMEGPSMIQRPVHAILMTSAYYYPPIFCSISSV